jgi:hypothetical protein
MFKRVIKIILILLAIFLFIVGIIWLLGRHGANKTGKTPLSFRQFLGLVLLLRAPILLQVKIARRLLIQMVRAGQIAQVVAPIVAVNLVVIVMAAVSEVATED